MESDNDSSENQLGISSKKIDEFYEGRTIKIKFEEDYQEEVSLFSEALSNPENTRYLLELKLRQLATSSDYDSLEKMESALSVDKSLDTDLAISAKLGLEKDDNVYFHSVMSKSVFVDDVTRKTYASKYNSRLFWVRSADGKLKEIRSDYPHLEHNTIRISDDKVLSGRVIRSGLGPNTTMNFSEQEPEVVSGSFISKFDSHNKKQPLRIKIKNVLSGFKQ